MTRPFPSAFLWGAVGITNTQDRVDGFDRLAVPGATTVLVTDPATILVYHESAGEVAGYALPTANARIAATQWDPATRTIVTVPSAGDTPTWQQLGLSVTGSGGAAVPVATYRSSARYDLDPGRAGRWRRSRPGPPGRTWCRPPGPPRPGSPSPWAKTSPAAWC